MPRVTVLMAVYNGERYLSDAIASVLSQTYESFEFLIVNDASTDGSREIILSFSDPRIRLVENRRNLGLARSLNRGLQLAEGDFIARQDADDLSEPPRLALQAEFLDAHPEVALVGSWYTEIDAAGDEVARHQLASGDTELRWNLLFVCPFVHSAVMLRRAPVLARVGGYDESLTYSLDYDLWVRISQHFRIANLPEYLVRWRTHPHSMTSTLAETTQEGYRLRLANVVRLLDWREAGAGEHEVRFRAMTNLLHGSSAEAPSAEILRAADDLLCLQRVFCAGNPLSTAESHRHRAELRQRLAWQLLRLAEVRQREGSLPGARQLLTRALQLALGLIRQFTLRLGARLLRPPWRGRVGRGISH